MLRHPQGLSAALAAIAEREATALPELQDEQVLAQNVAFEVAERTAGVKYPAVYVYCEGLANTLREKFRRFSGTVHMAAEVRVSHDRLENVGALLQLCVEAVTDVLEQNRGEWAPGMYYAGVYKVEYGAIKHGGKNFLQSAKVRFEVNVSQG